MNFTSRLSLVNEKQFGRDGWLEFHRNNNQLVVFGKFKVILRPRLIRLDHSYYTVDRLRCWNNRQHDRAGGAGVAPKSFAGRHSAVRWVSGRRRHWSDAHYCLDGSLWFTGTSLAFRAYWLQDTQDGAMADDKLFHMDAGHSLNRQVFVRTEICLAFSVWIIA